MKNIFLYLLLFFSVGFLKAQNSIVANNDLITIVNDTIVGVKFYLNDINLPSTGTITVTDPANGRVSITDNLTPDNLRDDEFTYTIRDPNFNGIDIFTYTICDNNIPSNCGSASVIVNVQNSNSALSLKTNTINNLTCFDSNNGTIETQVSGGKFPFRYEITDLRNITLLQTFNSDDSLNVFSNLADGEYSIKVVDDANNQIESLFDVSAPIEIQTAVSGENPSCNGNSNGSITINATGGTGTYSYAINTNPNQFQVSNVFTGLSEGNYQITVQDENGCSAINEAILVDPEPVTINSITSLPTGIEPSGNIVVGAIGGNGDYLFSINDSDFSPSNSFFDLAGGAYNVVAMDTNNCSSVSVEITILTLAIDNSVSEDPSGSGALSASFKGATSYQWINVDENLRIPEATKEDFIPTESGNYQVEMLIPNNIAVAARGLSVANNNIAAKGLSVVNNNIVAKELNILVDDQIVLSPVIAYTAAILSINTFEKNIKVFPNPASDFITIPSLLINEDYVIYNYLGKEVVKGKINSTTLKLSDLSSGIYHLKTSNYNAIRFIKK